jgi:signal transduction histidine kinase
MRIWPKSLQGQLVLRLAAVFLVATVAGVAALYYESIRTADVLRRDELLQRARQLAGLVVRDSDGAARVVLPAELDQIYSASKATNQFAIRFETGQALAASQPEFATATLAWPLGKPQPRYVRLKRFGGTSQEYCALTVREESAAGPVSITVARTLDGDDWVHAVLFDLVFNIGWAIPLFALATLAVGAMGIRRDLRAVQTVSERAATIAPESTGVRLGTERLPTELVPLVVAFNGALDRLESALKLQLEFTANAAHQLRTPLAILTAQLDELADGPPAEKLRGDVARMNRLIDQLLRVARLDNTSTSVETSVDLTTIAADVAKYLAPWAIEQGRTIGFEAPGEPVLVRGNADAITDALRNLVENAVCHTPPKTEVTVSVSSDGSVVVTDRGSGVAGKDRGRIFERFWRGPGVKTPGAGLGLAIVAEIARAHGGTVEVGDASGGGAKFSLRLQPSKGTAGFDLCNSRKT